MIGSSRVIDRVASRLPARLLLIDDLELLGHVGGRLVVAVQAEKRRIERGHVMGEHVARVALRVDGDEQHLHAARVRSELLHRGGELRERRRAEIRALRIAEKDDDGLAAKVGERTRLAVMVDQMEVAAEGRPGHVRALELGRRRATGGDGQREQQDGRQAHRTIRA